ncbi:MAG: hypothetical protein IM638_16150 [Bacteroidetes bacterium]|nr:hypothetical protein [Bacteroidota bacterium]
MAEVSVTGGILMVRILDEQPDKEAIVRHCRILNGKLNGVNYPAILDLRYLENIADLKIDDFLCFEKAVSSEVIILVRTAAKASGCSIFTVCENESDAIGRLRKSVQFD